ncbi:MAG: NAD(P)/FAD-dependent oxidoreductase [Pyrinomonadaceae bacterium]|nr:NAD(P)/FAD-dependent oxidoreductase [Pyrinomonadaceae bacterium]
MKHSKDSYDVIVVGAGPAGSVLGWELARRGVSVLLLEASRFPREKVCGDYIEPRGLRVLEAMGCLKQLDQRSPLPITHSATFVDSECHYRGQIPFYGLLKDLPPHGYIVPREQLDQLLFQTAANAGANVREESVVRSVSAGSNGVEVETRCGKRRVVFKGRLVVGADGVNSVVARSVDLLANDPRHIALSQRAYAEGLAGDFGEAVFYFEKDLFPGYGWMFPMRGGTVNFGVGILAESARRLNVKVPSLFKTFFEKLRRTHHRCEQLKLCRPPIGGIVKTYGGAGPNYFDGGLLIGDAGSFVDPMTGEGITPAIESALIAAPVIEKAVASGRFDADFLSLYEKEFRRYFDASMVFVDFCAAVMRNCHFREPWLRAVARGCEIAQQDHEFARTAGACFGGLEINPYNVLGEMWQKTVSELLNLFPRGLLSLVENRPNPVLAAARDWLAWQAGWWESITDDPVWHVNWQTDLQVKAIRAISIMYESKGDPRARGLV